MQCGSNCWSKRSKARSAIEVQLFVQYTAKKTMVSATKKALHAARLP